MHNRFSEIEQIGPCIYWVFVLLWQLCVFNKIFWYSNSDSLDLGSLLFAMPTSIPHGRGVVVWGSGVLQQTGRPPIPRPTVPRSDSLEPYGAGRIFLLTVWEQLVGAHFCRVTGSGVAPFKKRNWGQSWNFSLIEKKHDKNFKRVPYEQKRRKIKTYYQNFDTPQATPVKLFRSIGGNLYFLWGRLWRFSIFDISVSPFITYFFEENPFFFKRLL